MRRVGESSCIKDLEKLGLSAQRSWGCLSQGFGAVGNYLRQGFGAVGGMPEKELGWSCSYLPKGVGGGGNISYVQRIWYHWGYMRCLLCTCRRNWVELALELGLRLAAEIYLKKELLSIGVAFSYTKDLVEVGLSAQRSW